MKLYEVFYRYRERCFWEAMSAQNQEQVFELFNELSFQIDLIQCVSENISAVSSYLLGESKPDMNEFKGNRFYINSEVWCFTEARELTPKTYQQFIEEAKQAPPPTQQPNRRILHLGG